MSNPEPNSPTLYGANILKYPSSMHSGLSGKVWWE